MSTAVDITRQPMHLGAPLEYAPKPPRERPSLIDSAERMLLAMRLSLSIASGCLLIVALGIRFIFPAQKGLSDLVAGVAAVLVAGPVLAAAWESLRHPSLDGVTERLVALALIAAGPPATC